MIVTIIIMGIVIAGLIYLYGKQFFKLRTVKAQLKQQRHAIHAFEELEGKIGEMERYYAEKKTELEKVDNAGDVADILNGMQNRVHSASDNTPVNPRRKTG